VTTINLTKDNFQRTVSDNAMVVVDFWAPWCAPCRFFSPVFESASEKHPDVVFAKVNTEEERELSRMFGIRSIPSLMILRDEVILYSEAGALPPTEFEEIINKAKALDMQAVQREIEEEKKKRNPATPDSSA
jgi:thioredoxin 1